MIPRPANPLVAGLVAGQAEAYAALYDRLGAPLLKVARAMLYSSDEAEDTVQDVFLDLVRYRNRLATVVDLDAYVFAILRNAVLWRLKRQRNERRHLQQFSAADPGEKKDCVGDDLEAALALLPAEQREVITLKIDGGLTFAQVADVLNVSPNTAASRYRYALEKLRRALE